MTDNIKLPPLPPLHIVQRVEPVDYPEVAQVLMDYARAAVLADRERRAQPAPVAEALERVMYCNEVGFLPESVQKSVSDALSAHRKGGDV